MKECKEYLADSLWYFALLFIMVMASEGHTFSQILSPIYKSSRAGCLGLLEVGEELLHMLLKQRGVEPEKAY